MRTQKLLPKLSRQAKKYLESLDAKTQQRLKTGIEKIPEGDIIPYKGVPDDLYYIELAEKELTDGESLEWSDIEWK